MASDRSADVLYQICSERPRSEDDEDGCRAYDGAAIEGPSTVSHVLWSYPACAVVLKRHGLNCCACVNSGASTVESIARILDVTLPELLTELRIAARIAAPNTARLPDMLGKESD
ncbi:hypothetical protein HN371_09270 [Candidatus Poribacteria bacterium]|nr:hypothetical protein [Candidatus Poribacteria bacterium]MBT5535842.1 hypothetical protein [Candidatus Poribacteria bacterium]MBT5710336.1 hypothetical protein [Candidatus Poribacteria bacterium]MBT7804759.1 hypothetical protein [Candidatus Poribacteria bacterium]